MKFRLGILLGILLTCSSVWSQNNINEVEYFIDTDPGFGMGTNVTITPGQDLDINTNIDLTGLSNGIHFIYFRALNDSGWGNTYSQPFFMDENASAAATINVTDVEYFFDSDPGFGNGQTLIISPNTVQNISDNIDLTGLSEGLHMLHVRAMDQNGIWSNTYSRPIIMLGSTSITNVSTLEYFIDTDPGFGNATNVPITTGSPVIESFSIDLNGVTPGMHMLQLRAQNSNGMWSHVYAIPFVSLGASSTPTITNAEYYFDADPGFGNGLNLPITAGNTISEAVNLDLSGLTPGIHMVNMRSQNSNGIWSLNHSQPFIMLGQNNGEINYVEFHVDSFAGFGNGTPIDLNAGSVIDTSLVVSLDPAISRDNHSMMVVARDNNGAWSMLMQAQFCVGAKANFVIDTVCYGTPSPFTDLSLDVNSSTTYSWDVDNDSIVDYTTVGDITHPYPNDSTFTAMLILDRDSLCPDTAIYEAVVLPNSLQANFTSDSVCLGGTNTIFDLSLGVSSSTTYQWDIDNDGVVDSNTPGDITATYSNKGAHLVNLTIYDSPTCLSVFNDSVFVDSTSVNAYFVTDTNCVNTPTLFYDLSSGVDGSTTYDWDINNDGSVDYTTTGNISHVFPGIGAYSSSLILNSSELCPDTFISNNIVVDSLGTITGNVFNGNGNINSGYVKLYEYKPSGIMPLIDSVALDASGNYTFKNVENGDYIIKAIPDSNQYPNTVPTYVDSTISWSQASTIYSICDTTINIGLLDLSMVSGDGIINGYLFSTDTTNRAGDPIPGIDISLQQIPGGIIASGTTTNEDGFYEFKNLPNYTYQILVDIPGAPMDSTYTVTINTTDTVFENLNFIFDSASIFIDPVQETGLQEFVQNNYNFTAYPNPFNHRINIELNIDKPGSTLSLNVFDILGKKVAELHNGITSEGRFITTFIPGNYNLNAGIYTVVAQVNQDAPQSLKIVETKK